jgi:hypothetical protein
MRKFAGFVCVLLALSFATPAWADENPLPQEQRQYQRYQQWSPSPELNPGHVWYTYGVSAAKGFVNTVPFVTNQTQKKFCPTFASGCVKENDSIRSEGYLPLCSGGAPAPCINKFEARLENSVWVTAEFLGYVDLTPQEKSFTQYLNHLSKDFPLSKVYDTNTQVSWASKFSFPSSATGAAKFKISGVPNAAGSETYILRSTFDVAGLIKKSQASQSVYYNSFDTSISPYVDGNLSYADTSARVLMSNSKSDPMAYVGQFGATGDATNFAWSEYGKLGFAAAFGENSRFRVSLSIPTRLGGWYHGRMADPNLNLKNLGAGLSLLTIDAKPVDVPVTSNWVRLFDDNGKLTKFSREQTDSTHIESARKHDAAGQFGATGPIWEPSGQGLEEFNRHEAMLGTSSKGSAEVWSVSMMGQQDPTKSRCMQNTSSIQGLITTNSMVYQAGVPDFRNGFLDYKVAGLHYDHKNELALGQYDLIIKSDAARCLYGFSKAPLSAAVSVINDKGTKTTATTVVSEKNGWLKLRASGFTFSNKTIKVKITKKKK